MAIFISQKCRRSERYFRYKNTCPMLIKSGNIGKVFCMNGFPRIPEKRDIKREETNVGIWRSHILFTAQNLYHGMHRVRVLGSRCRLRDGRRGHAIVLFISACLYFTTTGFPVSGTNCNE